MMSLRWPLGLSACVMAALATTPAVADPIFTPLFTMLLPALGVSATSVAFGTTTWVALLSGIATVALGIGLSLLLTPKPPRPDDGHTAIQQTIPPQIYGYGRCRVAGFVVLKEATSNLYQINALAGHEIIGFVGWYLHDDAIEIDGVGNVTTAADGRYVGSVRLEGRLGRASETAYGEVVAAMPDIWTVDHRGDGCASLMMVCYGVGSKDFSNRFPYGVCQPSAVLDMARVFDPRDPAQLWHDASTWGIAGYDNPALVLIHFECFSEFGPHRDYAAAVLPLLDSWIGEANVCDELVPKKGGGTERRYRLGGWTTTEQTDPRATRLQILQSCDGWFVERGDGTIQFWAGKYRAPTVEITDDDICGWSWQSGLANSERSEWMVAKYTSPDNGYVSVDTDAVELDNGALALDQNRTTTIDLTWVQSTGQASRLLKREVIRYGEPVRGQLELRLSALDALYARWIVVRSSIPRLADSVIENRRPVISLMEGKCTMEFISCGAHIDDYDPTKDESSPPVVVAKPETSGLPIPSNVTATASQLVSGGIVSTYVDVVFDVPSSNGTERTDLSYDLRWRIAGTTTWQHILANQFTVSAHRITLTTGLVANNTTYELSVASVSTSNTYSDWSPTVTVSTAVTSTAPSAPINVTAAGAHASATVNWMSPNSPNIVACRLWRDVAGGSFAHATDVSGRIWCGPNQQLSRIDTPVSAGSWMYWVTAENNYGTASVPSSGASAIVT